MQEHEQAKFAATFNEYCENEYGIIYDTVRNVRLGKQPQPGDLVALRSNHLQRWVRCEVEELMVDLNQTTWCYLWAIDEGIPIKSNIKYVRPLPQAFVQESAHAKRGAIMNILPGETQYNYEQDEQILVPTTKWSPGIVSTLELMLETAESISFTPTNLFLLQNETIHVGELFITTQTNRTHNIAGKLREACPGQLIVTENEQFAEEIKYLQALKKKRYVNNAGFDNHVVNNFVTQQLHETAYTDPQTDSHVAMKVYEWLSRNKEARIAILNQQTADKEGTKEPPITMDLSFQKCDEGGGHAVPRGKSSKLIRNIQRRQTRMQPMKTGS